MSASPLNFLRAGPPPPKVALLPDALFFTRSIPIPAGTPPAAVAAQVELVLESISPFPIAQLYHGYFHAPGAPQAFVFATYRRRFTTDQTTDWADAELVLPTFAALLGGEIPAGTTLILSRADALTAVHGSASGSLEVLTEPLPAEPTDEDRARARESLIKAAGGSTTVVDLPVPPAAEPKESDSEIVFRTGSFVSRLPAATAAALDIRDKEQLATLRRARSRDVLFWRVAVGCVAALGLLALGELSLIGGRTLWQKNRLALAQAQKPVVEKIMGAQARAIRIDDLSTKRLLPLEMLSMVSAKKPTSILFVSARTDIADRDRLIVEAKAENSAEIDIFKSALQSSPEYSEVEVSNQRSSTGASATFTLSVNFKPGVVKPAPPL